MNADLVVREARIYTADPSRSWATCLAVSDGKISYLGDEAGVADFVGSGTEHLRLNGLVVMPGLFDAHTHAFEGMRSELFEIGLRPDMTLEQVAAALRAALIASERRWITGGPWGPSLARHFETEEGLTVLDAVSGERPVVLRDASFHSRLANSAALDAAGIDSGSSDPENGIIVRDPRSKRPTGLLLEAAAFMMDEAVPPWTAEENSRAALAAVQRYNTLGVTGFQLAVASRTTLKTFKALDDAGLLTARVAMTIAMEAGLAQARDGIGPEVVADRRAYATSRISVDFAKFFMDGVPSMRTASFAEPYLDDSGPTCPPYYAVDALAERMADLDRAGLSVKIHAIGDRAISDALDAIASVRKLNGTAGPQHQIAHATFVTARDIERMRDLNVLADLCPPLWFPGSAGDAIRRAVGEERAGRSWPVRALVEAGVDAVVGTDWPAIAPTPSPWPGLAGLVTRSDPYGDREGAHAPEQAIDVASAIDLHVAAPSRAMRLELVAGALGVGKSADLIVLDRNPFSVEPRDIAETQVLATWFEGRLVHGDPAALGWRATT